MLSISPENQTQLIYAGDHTNISEGGHETADSQAMQHSQALYGASDLSPEQVHDLERKSSYEMARRSTPAAFSYFAATAAIALTSSFTQDHGWVIYTALIAFSLSILLRFFLLIRFEQVYKTNPRNWYRLQILSIGLSSLTWGLVSSMAIIYYGTTWTAMLSTAITTGICAGGMYALGMNLRLLRIHLSATFLPAFIASVMINTASGYSLAAIYLTFFIYCQLQSRLINREYWEARINAIRLNAETQNQLHRLTYHDTLTDLPNRELFNDRLLQAMRETRRLHYSVGVLMLGLDRFNKINETLGHQAGDELLKEVAQRLRDCLREHDTVARYSGDTFGIVLPNLHKARDVARIAVKIMDKMGQPFEISGLELFVTVSIGITIYPNDARDYEELIKNAEATMHQIKKRGGNNYQYYESSINAEAMERLHLETKLRRALEREEFLLHFQPKIEMKNGRLTGFEALLRWCPDGADPMSPMKFIPILEDTGFIVPVGEWVLRTACLQNKLWQETHPYPVRIAVNLSARQFRDHGLVALVRCILNDTKLDAKWLELEITESMMMENTEHTLQILQELHEMGVHLSIDDFGTGYSSLAYLKRMPINTLKIDRSFVKDIISDKSDSAVVQTIIAMAHNLDLRVVAEGAETIEQVDFLRSQRCDEIQGFYFSKPLPAAEIHGMLTNTYCFSLPDAMPDLPASGNVQLFHRHNE